ncbi:sulfurtransferase TusA family protein [bacterium]|nr:sulfurtransferase TusA family protein [bacterium]
MSSKDNIAASLDIRLEICPMTFVKTKLELEELEPGDLLEVFVREGEPLENVARSVKDEGHTVLERKPLGDAIWRLLIERGED